jgi:molecular chaperone GrpE
MKRVLRKRESEWEELVQPEITAGADDVITEQRPVEEPAASQQANEQASEKATYAEVVPEAEDTVSKSEYDLLKAERDQLIDRLARLQAEFDNARKRAEREKADFRDFATGNVVDQFLPVVDNFQLALASTGDVEQLRSGVQLIVKQMEETLQRMNVTAIPAVGEPFDPRVHEALGSVDRNDIPDQHVAEEIRRGYKLRDRLLRPALVRVAHNTKQVSE